jgi:hypothetical protein
MRMCEYANNLIDMGLLVYLAEKNREIIYERISDWTTSLLFDSSYYDSFYIVFPEMFANLIYIRLNKGNSIISFAKSNSISLSFNIYYGW